MASSADGRRPAHDGDDGGRFADSADTADHGRTTVSDRPLLLLVDDDPDLLLLLRSVLRKDYEVETARDGEAAWERLGDDEARLPDLVVCDVMMPRLRGDELVKRVTEDARLDRVPVILLTGNDNREMRLDMLGLGVADYLTKPFPPGELQLRVRNTLRDVMLMRELSAARQQAEDANRELREVNAELDRFAAAAAHDLQAPLANVASYTRMVVDGLVADEDKQRELLTAVAENAERAGALVGELLTHARTIASKDEAAAVDLGRLAAQAVRHLEATFDEAHAHLLVDEPLPYVRARPVAVERVLLNLFSNAVKYRHRDRAPLIRLSARPADDPREVEVVVADNGQGIPAEDREKVFGLGQQGSGTSDASSTGIGLATVRAVVQRHGGRIWLRDADGGGLAVHFTLPAA